MKRQVADRLAFCALVLIDLGTARYELTTLRHAVLAAGGAPAEMLSLAMAIVTLLVLADTVINDMLPERFVFTCGWRWRQRLWLLLATLLMVQAFVLARMGIGMWLAAAYVVLALRAVAVSFLDLHFERAAVRKDRRSTDFGDLHA